MAEKTRELKLGDLLLKLDLLQEGELSEAVEIAFQISLPLGRALVLSGKLSEADLAVSLKLQSLLRDAVIDLDGAKEALKLIKREKVSVADALEKLNLTKRGEARQTGSKLASLLVDSGLVSPDKMEEALSLSYDSGTAAGRMLVLSGAVSYQALARALELQRMMREGKLSYENAVQQMTAEGRRQLPVERAAEQYGINPNSKFKTVRLGELLMLAGILTENDMLNALETGFSTARNMGDILIELGLISEPLLKQALVLQAEIAAGSKDINIAAAELQSMLNPESSTPSKSKKDEVRLGELLQRTGLIDAEDISKALNLGSKFPALLGKMLVVAGSIDEGTLLAAIRCQFLLRNELISGEDANRVLLYSQRHRISLDDALSELGIEIPQAAKRELVDGEN